MVRQFLTLGFLRMYSMTVIRDLNVPAGPLCAHLFGGYTQFLHSAGHQRWFSPPIGSATLHQSQLSRKRL